MKIKQFKNTTHYKFKKDQLDQIIAWNLLKYLADITQENFDDLLDSIENKCIQTGARGET